MIYTHKKKEKWKVVNIDDVRKDYYYISSYGNIKNINEKILSTYEDKDGYLRCTLYTSNGTRKHYFIHRLVAYHFIKNPKKYPEVNHLKPYNKQDNYYKYLEWCSHTKNIKHSLKHHLQNFLTCEDHGMATLTNDQVHEICKLIKEGYTNKEILNYLDIQGKDKRERMRGIIKHIRSGNTWKKISKQYDIK